MFSEKFRKIKSKIKIFSLKQPEKEKLAFFFTQTQKMRERGNIFSALFLKNRCFKKAIFYFVQNHFWSSEERFFISKNVKILYLNYDFLQKIF